MGPPLLERGRRRWLLVFPSASEAGHESRRRNVELSLFLEPLFVTRGQVCELDAPLASSWVVRVPLPEASRPEIDPTGDVMDAVHMSTARMRAQALALDGLSFRVHAESAIVL